jgi:hypothetical protein
MPRHFVGIARLMKRGLVPAVLVPYVLLCVALVMLVQQRTPTFHTQLPATTSQFTLEGIFQSANPSSRMTSDASERDSPADAHKLFAQFSIYHKVQGECSRAVIATIINHKLSLVDALELCLFNSNCTFFSFRPSWGVTLCSGRHHPQVPTDAELSKAPLSGWISGDKIGCESFGYEEALSTHHVGALPTCVREQGHLRPSCHMSACPLTSVLQAVPFRSALPSSVCPTCLTSWLTTQYGWEESTCARTLYSASRCTSTRFMGSAAGRTRFKSAFRSVDGHCSTHLSPVCRRQLLCPSFPTTRSYQQSCSSQTCYGSTRTENSQP